jgi:hypothetical protein
MVSKLNIFINETTSQGLSYLSVAKCIMKKKETLKRFQCENFYLLKKKNKKIKIKPVKFHSSESSGGKKLF